MFERPEGYELWHSFEYCFAMVPGLLIGLIGFAADTRNGGCIVSSGIPVVYLLSPLHVILLLVAVHSVLDRPGYRVSTLLGMSAAPYAIVGAYSAFAVHFNYRPAPLIWFKPSHFGVTLPTMQFAKTCMVYAGLCLFVPSLPISHWRAEQRSRSQSHCWQCGYDLTGLPGDICPECGGSTPNNGDRTIIPSGSGDGVVGTPIDDAGPV